MFGRKTIVTIGLFFILSAGVTDAQYVWNGTDGTEYAYGGTDNPPWGSDASVTGKLISSGTNVILKPVSGASYVFIDASSLPLTITNAVVNTSTTTATCRTYINSSMTINSGGVFNAQSGLWMANGNYTSYLTINAGGTMNVTNSHSYISDNKNGVAIIDINGGTLNIGTEAANYSFALGHHGAMTTTVRNGGQVNALGTFSVGAGDANSTATGIELSRVLTLGTAGQTEDTSAITAKRLEIGQNSNSSFIMHSGTINAGAMNVGGNKIGILNVDGGTINVTGKMTVGMNTGSNFDAANGTYTSSTLTNARLNISDTLEVKQGYVTLDQMGDLNFKAWISSSTSARLTLTDTNLVLPDSMAVMTSSKSETDMAELVIGKGATLTIAPTDKCFWLSQNNGTKSKLTIQDGGVFNNNGASYIVDKNDATGELVIDNGAYIANAMVSLGHRGFLKGTITNGGYITTTKDLYIGGQNNDYVETLLADVTLGTAGTHDGSYLHGQIVRIGERGKGKLTMYGAELSSSSALTVGNQRFTNNDTGVTVFADGELYAYDSVISSVNEMTFGENAKATVRLENSTLTASSLRIGYGSTGLGNVEFINSQLDIPVASAIDFRRGTLLLKGTDYTTTAAVTVGSDSAIDTTMTIEDSTFSAAALYIRNYEGSGNYKSSVIINDGGTIALTGGMWMSNATNGRSYLEINKGGLLTVGTTAYLSDNITNAYANMYINGGTLQTAELNIGWWGPMDTEVANGGQILTTGKIEFNSSNYSTAADVKTGDLTISGGGSLIKATGNIYFGNTTRDAVTVNLLMSDTGFGTIQANNISMINGSYVFDAIQPISVITNYEEGKGVLLLDATNSLTNFGAAQTSGTWTAALSDNNKQVWATTTNQLLGSIVVDGTALSLEHSASSGSASVTSGSDPLRLIMQMEGLKTIAETEALATVLNQSFDSLTATALDTNVIALNGLSPNLSEAMINWDFSSLVDQYPGLAIVGTRAQSVPEPATWVMLVLGLMAGITFIRRRKNS